MFAKVKKRFVQWVLNACFRPHDQAWLDYQEEIGQRPTPEKKNHTDGTVACAAPLSDRIWTCDRDHDPQVCRECGNPR
jgi:hypothetical protein